MSSHHAAANLAQAVEPTGVLGRNSGFNVGTSSLRYRRPLARRGDGYLQVSSTNQGSVIEIATIRVVDGIAENPATFGCLEHRLIHLTQRRRRDYQNRTVHIFRFEAAGVPSDHSEARPFGHCWTGFESDNADLGPSYQQTADFRLADCAGADDQAFAIFQLQKHWKQAHSCVSLLRGLKPA